MSTSSLHKESTDSLIMCIDKMIDSPLEPSSRHSYRPGCLPSQGYVYHTWHTTLRACFTSRGGLGLERLSTTHMADLATSGTDCKLMHYS